MTPTQTMSNPMKVELQKVLAKMLGQRFVFPSLEIAVRELKAAYNAFMEGANDAASHDMEALQLLETIADQSRMLGEKETGKDFGEKLAKAYLDLMAFRAGV